jgi:hypothetical protein
MALTGTAAYFVESLPDDVLGCIRQTFDVLRVSVCRSASVYSRPPTPVRLAGGSAILDAREADTPNPFNQIGQDMTPEQVAAACARHPYVFMAITSSRSHELFDAIRRDIPQAISDTAFVANPAIRVGPEDWYEEGHGADPLVCEHYWGRSMFAVSLFGYGTPHDWNEYRRRVFEIPEFKAFQAELEAILGPVKRCITWSA